VIKLRDLARLRQLADTVYEAELAKMRGNRAAASAIEAEVAAVRRSRRERADEMRALDTPDPAQFASADLHWDRWTDARLFRLQSERARLEAEAARMRAGARRAFGRGQALAGLEEKLEFEARRAESRLSNE
jgi:hypothetical protein